MKQIVKQIVKQRSLSLFASISLAIAFAFASLPVTAAPNPPVAGPDGAVVAATAAEPFAATDPLPSSHLFDQDELAELAALESRHADLQEQKAGRLGGTASTILVVALVLVLLL